VGVASDEYLEPILHTGGGHLLTVAPTGAGKGVSCIIPTLLRFPGPTIVVDPKGENYAVTAKRRRELGQEIILLDPMGITGHEASSLNPLDLIDPAYSVSIDDAAALSSLLTGGIEKVDPQNVFWYQRGEQLTTGLIQHIAISRPPGKRNLTELRRLLNLPADDFTAMVENEMMESPDEDVRSVGGMLTNPAVEMVGSIIGMAQHSLEFLRGDLVEDATNTSSFDLDAVTRGDALSIYLVIPPDKLESHRNLLRVWIGSLMSALMRRRAPPPHRTLFILDEAAQLGSLQQLRQAITLMRGYGLQTWSFWQDLSQLRNLYPTDWETMYNNCRVHQSFGFTNLSAARSAADLVGFYDALEVLQLDVDEMILGIAGDEAVIARKANYLTDPAFRGVYAENPFYKEAGERVPRPRRPQRRYIRPQSVGPATDPTVVSAPVPEPQEPSGTQEVEGPSDPTHPPGPTRPSTPPEPGALSARMTVLEPAHDEADDLPAGIALEGYHRVEVVPSSDTAELLRSLSDVLPGDEWSPYSVVARRAPVPFYPGHVLYEIMDASRVPPREWVILGKSGKVRLDWTNKVFYALNEQVPIALTDENVFEYLKLFFRFVRGRHGHFHVAEVVNDIPLPWVGTPEGATALEPHVRPLTLRETLDDGTRVIEARFVFRDSVFSSMVHIGDDGQVDLMDEEMVVKSIERLATGSGDDTEDES